MLEPLTDVKRRQALCRAVFLADDNTFIFMEEMMRVCQTSIIQETMGEDPLEIFDDVVEDMAKVLKKDRARNQKGR